MLSVTSVSALMGTVHVGPAARQLPLQGSGGLALGIGLGERSVDDHGLVELPLERIDRPEAARGLASTGVRAQFFDRASPLSQAALRSPSGLPWAFSAASKKAADETARPAWARPNSSMNLSNGLVAHDVAQLGQDEHPFSRGDVVPVVGAQVGADLGKREVLAAPAGDGRQVARGRREEGQREPLAVADAQSCRRPHAALMAFSRATIRS